MIYWFTYRKEANKLKSKSNLRRKETARRHTVQSGIDFATLKRLKQLEQERDVLQQGLGFLDSTKEWYHKQLESVEEKITLLNKGVTPSVSDVITCTLEQYLEFHIFIYDWDNELFVPCCIGTLERNFRRAFELTGL